MHTLDGCIEGSIDYFLHTCKLRWRSRCLLRFAPTRELQQT